MKRTDFWKNFNLGDELSISGAFIYNGMRRFHEMQMLEFTDEVFEILYNLSVGFERLLKITVVLLEHDEAIEQEVLEKSLITHSHLDLLRRVKKHVPLDLAAPHNDFLSLLGKFYKTHRYDRFRIASAYNSEREIKALCEFFRKHLNVEILRGDSLFGAENEDRYRRFFRKTLLKISMALYAIVETHARDLNLYTYELRHGSKAETVFLREVDISDEDVLWKELLVFLMNTKSTSEYLEFLRGIAPLDFDPELVGDYLACFRSDASKSLVMDELEHYYLEMEGKEGERLELMRVIASGNIYFDVPEDEPDVEP